MRNNVSREKYRGETRFLVGTDANKIKELRWFPRLRPIPIRGTHRLGDLVPFEVSVKSG